MTLQIHILEIESSLEAQAVRATAEALGVSVSVTWVANSRQVVEFLSQVPKHSLIFICGHGDERGILLPTLADEVKAQFPFNDVLTAENIASFVRLEGNVVLSSCCATGTKALASAFLENRAGYFIAPVDYPDGDAALLFCLQFLFGFLKTSSVEEAFEAANRCVEGDNKFCLFSREK